MKKDDTHLSQEQRVRISSLLERGKSFKEIGRELGRASTTISREVRNHIVVKQKGVQGSRFNDCKKRGQRLCPIKWYKSCIKHDYCEKESCASCQYGPCGERCKGYEKLICERLLSPPYVCNGCTNNNNSGRCRLERRLYDPLRAHKDYEVLLSSCRSGIHNTQKELDKMDKLLEEAITNKHQSVNHLFSYSSEDFGCSQRKIYNLINDGVFPSCRRGDMPRSPRFKVKQKEKEAKRESKCVEGRKYDDFVTYIKEHQEAPLSIVEMDTVVGKQGGNGRVLLTLLFRNTSLQLAFVLEKKTQENVVNTFLELRNTLGEDKYKRLFNVILTDRGSEFLSPELLERNSESGEEITKVFYCDPMRSNQKGSCENNHSAIRRFIAKGSDITITQSGANLMMSHIASLCRPQYNNKMAYDMFAYLYDEDTLEKLGIQRINAKDVTLSPALFKKQN